MHSENRTSLLSFLCVSTLLSLTSILRAEDWPGWRGANSDNHAPEDTNVPIRWDLESGSNIAWKTAIPGRGHSSPIVIGEMIFLTTAEAEN